jgi:hypothetical protein
MVRFGLPREEGREQEHGARPRETVETAPRAETGDGEDEQIEDDQ